MATHSHTGGLGGFEDYQVPDIVATSLVGYRQFGPLPVTTMLHGLTKTEYTWVAGKNEAKCLRNRQTSAAFKEQQMIDQHKKEQIPVQDCACGFWAYWDMNTSALSNNTVRLVGVIQAWGKLIVGPLGFRAQYAKIIALAVPDEKVEVYPSIRAQYPGVKWYDDKFEMAAIHPSNNVFPTIHKSPEFKEDNDYGYGTN
jgi:hypothetical protein